MKKINWAVLAPGNIARSFAVALQGVELAHLYSVASRDADRAKAFADEFGFETSAGDYDELMADPKVDAIYIASPHTFHREQSVACLLAGKAVLCEKPMTISRAEARRVFDTARQHKRFFMEAVWTRFLPILNQVRDWIDEGAIGEVQMVQASFGFAMPYDEEHRVYDINLAGGSLLDVGIYPITLAQWVMQEPPLQIAALGDIGRSGVDERTGIVLRYSNGAIATLNSSITSNTSHEAWIYGTKGSIQMPRFWCGEEARLIVDGKEKAVVIPHRINGYEGEIEEVNRCLNAGLIESPVMPWNESSTVLEIMDEVREQIGLRYPMEDA